MLNYNEYDFALGFSRQLSTNQLNTISFIFDQKDFKHLVVKDPKISRYSVVFIHHDNPEEFLKEAEKHYFLKRKYEKSTVFDQSRPKTSKLKELLIQKGAENLDSRVKQLETMRRFTFNDRKLFLSESDSIQEYDKKNSYDSLQNSSNGCHNKENNRKASFQTLSTKTSFDTSLSSVRINRDKSRSYTKIPIVQKKASVKLLSNDSKEDQNPSKNQESEDFNAYLSIFTPSEYCQVIWSLLNKIEINIHDPSILEIFNIDEKFIASFPNRKLMKILKNLKLLEFARPLHTREVKTSLSDTDSMKDYFGDKVTVYFEFMLFYIKWLTVPAICGIFNQYALFESKPGLKFWLDTLYCLVIMIWGALFVRFWERKTNEIRVKWGTYGFNFKISNTRENFKGTPRVNPITELPELYYRPKKKFFQYCVSLLTHLPLFLLSLFVAILYLNVKGNVVPGHWIYFEQIAVLAEPGEIFGKGSHLKIIPWAGRLALKSIFKYLNNFLSNKTTNWENHRTHTGYNNSLITKRFLFGMVNTFTNLTYIAFWKLDLEALREELLTLYISDELKRLVVEALLPYIRKKVFAKKFEDFSTISKKALSENKKSEHLKNETISEVKALEKSLDQYIVKKVNEINGREYNVFQDYYEMVMQFGYITLFAVAFPLAGVISLLLNVVELRSDFFKLKNVLRRPMPEAVDGIGAWLGTLKAMTYFSVITNSVLIANAAEFRTAMAKELMEQPIEGQEGKVLGVVFMVEHFMLAIIFLLRKFIEKKPAWVNVYVKRNLEKGSGLWEKTD